MTKSRGFLGTQLRPLTGRTQHKVAISNAEAPVVALIRQLLCPATVVITLCLCAIAYQQQLSIPYVTLALFAFVISAQVFNEIDLNPLRSKGLFNLIERDVFVEWLVVVAVLLLLAFSMKVSDVFSRKVVLTWFAVTPFALAGSRAFARTLLRWLVDNAIVVRTQLIVGATEIGCTLAQRLSEDPCLGTMEGFFDDRKLDRLPTVKRDHLLGPLNDLVDYVRTHSINVIYISLPITAEPRIVKLLDELRDTTASIYFVPDILVSDLIHAHFVDVNGIPVVAICETPFCGMNGVLKRASDILLVGLMLLFGWPFMLAIAIGVKLSSDGPVLFKQRRYGLDGEEIIVYKFRTMRVCEDGPQIVQAQKGDKRVTSFGLFLRRTSLDELPQLFNVVQNKMSLVGPRPHAVAHNEQYRKLIRGYMLRHKVKPGITGWAQVNGLRGETDTLEKMKQRVEYDLEYLKNWSLWLDLQIIAKTAWVIWHDRNAY
jgi:putative colanic acid biosynthesis UDP-glucose lipid carrier transferase